jgi:hypothetical protein
MEDINQEFKEKCIETSTIMWNFVFKLEKF